LVISKYSALHSTVSLPGTRVISCWGNNHKKKTLYPVCIVVWIAQV